MGVSSPKVGGEVYNRRFTVIPEDILKKYNKTFKELNELSLADKKILDTIVQAIKINNKEFMDIITENYKIIKENYG